MICKERGVKTRPMAHFKEEDDIANIPILGKKESSVRIETTIPYSEIPCLKCKGKREKKDGKTCNKCDGSGKMKNTKKLRKIEYLIDKKLQALLNELESRRIQSELKQESPKIRSKTYIFFNIYFNLYIQYFFIIHMFR